MLIEVIQVISIAYYLMWFIWPFIFVFTFAYGLKEIIKNENASNKPLIWAAISLIVILSGLTAPHFN